MSHSPLVLDGHSLSLQAAAEVARGGRPRLAFCPDALERVRAARGYIEDVVASGAVVYGITTGFGKLKSIKISAEDTRELQRNLLRSHAVGTGPDAPPEVVRLMLLLRLNTLLQGHSGVRVEVPELLAALLESDLLPRVPEQGSVGASGDLAPLAHLALVLQGEGEVLVEGVYHPAGEALAAAGLRPLELQAKEGLALINGTQFTAAVGGLAVIEGWQLAKEADVALAMSLEALQGSLTPFDARVASLRPHPGHAEVARSLQMLLEGSEILESHKDCGRVQDPYSLRCAPQVHGAVRDALRHADEVLEREINSVTDNPLIFPAEGESLSAGNFHAEPLGLPLDYAKAALCELGSISERRLEQLVNPDLSGLPPFLAGGKAGVNSGLMIVQVLAAALVSENKVYAHPATVDSIPTSANQEDHVSMAPIAARHLRQVLRHGRRILAAELLGGKLGLHFRRPLRAGRGVEAAFGVLDDFVTEPGPDRGYKEELDRIQDRLEDGTLLAAVEERCGPLPGGPERTSLA